MRATNPIIGTPASSGGNPPGHMEKAFVARQAIYRDDVKVFAYELLFRNNELNQAAFTNGDQATAQLVVDTFMEIGLDRVVGPNLAFVHVTRNFLLSDYCSMLPKDRVVLQLSEDTIPDAPLLDAISRLWKEGYPIALNNFRYSEWLRPLLALADIVKLDVQALGREAIGKQVELLRQFDAKLLAQKVETHEDYEYCKKLGFDYYQGFFFCKPQIVSEDKIPSNRMSALRLLAKLQDPNLTTDELEETVSQDVALSYKLIRYVNSALHALPQEVASIRHAIVLVGTRRISNWAGLILYGQMDDKPSELMMTAIVRARMCQQLALATNQTNAEQFFTVGLFSVLDALLDRPMANALDLLPIAQELKAALVDHQGLMGSALHCVMAYERGDWDQAQCGAIPPETIYDSYVKALEWTRRTMQELGFEPDLRPQESIRRRSEAKLKLQKFADEQEQKIKQAEEDARKRVTRDLLARFDFEFQRLSLEFEEKQQHAIAATENAAHLRLKEVLAEAERAKENLKREFESAAQQWEVERQQLRQEERTANQAAQVKREELAELEVKLSEVTHEKARSEEELRQAESRWNTERNSLKSLLSGVGTEMEQLKADFEARRLEAIAAAEAVAEMRFQQAQQGIQTPLSPPIEAKLEEVTREKSRLQEEFREASARWNAERERLEKSRQPPRSDTRDVSGAVTAEISRIEPVIEDLSRKIEDDSTDLSAQIRFNRERSELEAYLKGLRYSLGEVTFEN